MADIESGELTPAIEFDPIQQQAIDACCDIRRRIIPITGMAGSGKTLLIREIGRQLTLSGYSVAASAPTGKAARRINELTGLPAVTNHRLLGYGMPVEIQEEDFKGNVTKHMMSTGPLYKRSKPLPYDVLLCDEYAMVNNEIHRNLIDALKPGARICMFGDVNQLKPIEEDKRLDSRPSSFMQMMEKFSGFRLMTNHRQIEGSGIAENGERILMGKPPKRFDDFSIVMSDSPVRHIQQFLIDQEKLGVNYSSTDAQIITCMNKTWIGTRKLNLVIQTLYWDRTRPFLELPRHRIPGEPGEDSRIRVQVGTKIVYTANTYDMGNQESVFNGEVGHVRNIDFDTGALDIDFGDRVVSVPPVIVVMRPNGRAVEQDPRRNIDLAYVLTTHKCQGSEFKHVVYMMNKSTLFNQSRRNFYTGVTRARTKCTMIADMVSITKSTRHPG